MIVGAVFVQPQSEYTGKTFSNFPPQADNPSLHRPSASAAHLVAAASALHTSRDQLPCFASWAAACKSAPIATSSAAPASSMPLHAPCCSCALTALISAAMFLFLPRFALPFAQLAAAAGAVRVERIQAATDAFSSSESHPPPPPPPLSEQTCSPHQNPTPGPPRACFHECFQQEEQHLDQREQQAPCRSTAAQSP